MSAPPTRISAGPRPARRLLVALATVGLALGATISPAGSETTRPSAGDREAVTEPVDAVRGATSIPQAAEAPAIPTPPPRMGSWRLWPGSRLDGAREGSTMDGMPDYNHGGATCWPHGDHFHCR